MRRDLAGGLVAALFLGLGLQACAAGQSATPVDVDTAASVDRPEVRIAADVQPGMVMERLPRDDSVRPGRRLRVDGDVLPILTAPVVDGAAQLPGGLDEVGWLATTRRPGASAGTTTLAVHSSRNGDAPLQGLHGLGRGETVTVEWAGKRHRYRVTRVQRGLDPLDLPQRLVSRDGRPVLAIVTCSGWDGDTWTSRVVAYSVPLE